MLNHHLWYVITHVGATPFTMAVGALMAVWLYMSGRQSARQPVKQSVAGDFADRVDQGSQAWLVWISGFAIVLVLVTLSKLLYIGWDLGIDALNFTGFSGHAARAGAVMPLTFFMACGPASVRWRWRAFGLGTIVACAIAVSRLEILVHSPVEALTGLFLGLAAAALTCKYVSYRPFSSTVPVVLIAMLLVFVLMRQGALHVPTESWLDSIAAKLSGRTPQTARPYPLAGPWVWTYRD